MKEPPCGSSVVTTMIGFAETRNQLLPTLQVAGKIYQGLLRYSFELKPTPCLAKSWTISPDGRVYTFALEPNVKWHDGEPVTPDTAQRGQSVDKAIWNLVDEQKPAGDKFNDEDDEAHHDERRQQAVRALE